MQQHDQPQRKPAPRAPHRVAYEQEYLAWHQRENSTIGEPFDPGPLVAAARRQWRQWPQLIAALERCTMRFPESLLYDHFVPRRVQRLSWKFAGTWFLDHTPWGEVALDVIHDPDNPGGFLIGGMEYVERVMTWPMNKVGDLVPPDSPDAMDREHRA